ncbi:heme-binding protein [Halomarina ordinaria]|uniref:Heme-binding protein n=1 Tax=Halomarina ordinaria TaxID=3033939 RepID=A0ABD5U9N9_9EURY|nr:heme-binding protein [Halomarina sp. PSRA2]
MPRPPQTDEGWYALHDFRSVDWDAWRAASDDERERAVEEGVAYLETHEALDDVDGEEGATAVFSVLGHKADLLVFHLRPTTAALDTAERRFEGTALARFTDRASSYVSVTEASGYSESGRAYFEEGPEAVDAGLRRYIESRIRPSIPDAEHVCFYPMDKRREEPHNWYDLPFDERADLMSAHGDIGRGYAGKVSQIITGSLGFDDHEWGVTLFADDPTEIKHLLYEMRFDPSSSRYAEFGPFYFGRRIPPADLGALLAGAPVPTGEHAIGAPDDTLDADVDALGADVPDGSHVALVRSEAEHREVDSAVADLRESFDHYDSHRGTTVHEADGETAVVSAWETERAVDTAAGFLEDLPGVTGLTVGVVGGEAGDDGADERAVDTDADAVDDIRGELADLDIYAGKPHGEDVYALVLYSDADEATFVPEVDSLADGFDRYDTHVKTAVYAARERERLAVVSIWETQSAADTASGYLADLPGIVARAGEESGFGTMGMFYTTKPEYREEFVERFDAVGDLLADMEGHVETDLMVNVEAATDMFIASQWRAREDAMAFFRSDAFRDTVQWGRDVLADRPRHVFLA